MVSRVRAFTIAVVWIAAGLAIGIVALSLASGGLGGRSLTTAAIGAFRDGLRWWIILVLGGVVVAGIWIGVAYRNARSSAGLGAQGALIAFVTLTLGLLLLLIAGQVTR
jgi:hypothetical protein